MKRTVAPSPEQSAARAPSSGRAALFGLAFKLGLLLACVGMLASGLTGFYAYQASRSMLVESAKAELLTTTQVLARRIGQSREEISRNLQVLAQHPAALDALRGNRPAQEDQLATLFERILLANPSYFQIRLISAADNGLERVRVDRAGEHLVRVQGDDLQEKAHFPYVSGTLKLAPGTTYLSRIVINHERGAHAGLDQPSVILGTPVVDADGRALGVMIINVDLNAVFTALTADLPRDYQLFLANRAGDYLIHPDPSKTFGFDKGRRVLLQEEFPGTQALVDSQTEKLLTEVRDGPYAEAPVVAAFIGRKTRVAGDEDRLILGLAQPLGAVLAQAERLGAVVLQLVGGFCLACLALAVLVARAVTRPINSLSRAVERFAFGHETAALPVQRQDEIGVLARSVNRMQEEIRHQLVTLERNREDLEHLARHDPLTGLPNRRAFQERLELTLARAQRSGERFALLFIDVDQFKSINDRWGHEGGDAALKIVAQRLSAAVRKADAVARMGGDEFVVLLENPTRREDIVVIAEKLLDSMHSPILHAGQEMQVGFSIGISQYPDDGDTAAALLSRADHAMYATKAAGRNGFRFSGSKGTPTNPTPL
jgi:diguanylate cyclase (GGDEF)-like protein